MNIQQLAQHYFDQGYTARGDTLYSPSGFAQTGLIRGGDLVVFPEQLARIIEPMQRAGVDKRGKRDLRGKIMYSAPTKMF